MSSNISLNNASMSSNSILRGFMETEDEESIAGSGGNEDGMYKITRSLLRLLQLLVEGHNFRIQEYMRFQPDNIKSFNIVQDVVDFLHVLINFREPHVIPLMIQVLDTIIELSQVKISFFSISSLTKY
jgi:hypothetical protein